MKYAIQIKPYFTNVRNVFWSNRHGWTNLDNADLFSYEESMCLPAPINAQWVNIEDLEQ